ncbi:hypothetical protein TIFTF001_016064 [Ficus carica]|uniref:Uncharacterized protein n=1 Tax=Ficus carica TaxID=3494 RepID=A0AA88A6V4_FICCA|nr:hypothetical protein TIFTF001_016064 [Ficus carica]
MDGTFLLRDSATSWVVAALQSHCSRAGLLQRREKGEMIRAELPPSSRCPRHHQHLTS